MKSKKEKSKGKNPECMGWALRADRRCRVSAEILIFDF
jgi:hypothetical protein